MASKPIGAKEAALRELRERNAEAEASPKGKTKGKPKPKAKDPGRPVPPHGSGP